MDTTTLTIETLSSLDWLGLYRERWQKEVVPEAVIHPAKFAPALIRHIYDHATEEGWLRLGDTVLDPFGGVALGALHALRHGTHWVGVEIEDNFVELGNRNIALWNQKYGSMHQWGTARIVQGDSRRLEEVVEGAVAVTISSPPFGSGDSAGPESLNRRTDKSAEWCRRNQKWVVDGNGQGPQGNLANLPMRDFDAVVSSPPYEEGIGHKCLKPTKAVASRMRAWQRYGESGDNLGHRTGDTFWSAARQIVEQVYAILRPGGHAVWVTKAFVKNKLIVDFPGQWQAVCESVGFRTLHAHRAWMVEEYGTQLGLDGNHRKIAKARKSFFRILAEKKGSPRIDFEVVLCMERP